MKKLISIILVLLSVVSYAKISPTESHAAITVKVSDFENKLKEGETVIFEGLNTKKLFKGSTDANGIVEILIPKGDTYLIKIRTIGDEADYNRITIPNEPGLMSSELIIKFEMPKSFTLNNVYFNTGKVSLRADSYGSLDDLVEVMKLKKGLRIEIAGHTDDVGDEAKNVELSQQRAESVKTYLVNKGVEAQRVIAKGYGETQPVAYNTTTEGRQKNRRTEVRILAD